MSIVKYVCAFIVFYLLGIFSGFLVANHSRLEDEYAYLTRTNNLLYQNHIDDGAAVNKELNDLVYLHFNRYLAYRGKYPKALLHEIDEMMCGAFVMNEKYYATYKDILARNVYTYIEDNLDFCAATPPVFLSQE